MPYSNRSPNWTRELAYQQRGGAYSNMVSVGVSIPLPIHRKNDKDRDAAEKAELGIKARLMYEDAQRQVEACRNFDIELRHCRVLKITSRSA